MMRGHAELRSIIIFFVLCACVVFMNGNQVSAAKAETRIFQDTENGTIAKCGRYYLKWSNSNVYISDQKDGVYELTPITYGACANANKAYYIDHTGKTLCEYSFAKRESKTLKTLCQASQDLYLSVSGVCGNNVFVTCGGEETWRYDTYVYNTKKNKVIQTIEDCCIGCFNGNYAISSPAYHTDVSGSRLDLYKISNGGLKKVKKLCNYGFSYAKVGKKFYYTDYPDKYSNIDGYKMDRVVIYKCNANGSGRKRVATITGKGEYAQVIVQKFTNKYLEYWDGSGTYRYVYKTKKITKIQ